MVVFAAPFSQVSGHLLPSQAGELNPLPGGSGLRAPYVTRGPTALGLVREDFIGPGCGRL
jgi:hypothetical protein